MFNQFPDIMSIKDLQGALGIVRTKAYELIRTGEIRSIRIGKAIRIPKKALLDYVNGFVYNNYRNCVGSCLKEKEVS